MSQLVEDAIVGLAGIMDTIMVCYNFLQRQVFILRFYWSYCFYFLFSFQYQIYLSVKTLYLRVDPFFNKISEL